MPSTVPSLMFTPPPHTPSPHSYIKMDNFYTVTVYEKGAEVVRLYNTLLGKEGFRKGEREEGSLNCVWVGLRERGAVGNQ